MNDSIKTPSLDGDKVVQLYPKSLSKYKEWLGKFPNQEVLGAMGGIDNLIYDNALKAIFYYNPRSLYEFFDAQNLELVIGKVDDHWYFTITGDMSSYSADSRIIAEEKGFQLAFEKLEVKL